MREAGAIGAGRHEILHKILKSEFAGPNGEKLKNEFLGAAPAISHGTVKMTPKFKAYVNMAKASTS